VDGPRGPPPTWCALLDCSGRSRRPLSDLLYPRRCVTTEASAILTPMSVEFRRDDRRCVSSRTHSRPVGSIANLCAAAARSGRTTRSSSHRRPAPPWVSKTLDESVLRWTRRYGSCRDSARVGFAALSMKASIAFPSSWWRSSRQSPLRELVACATPRSLCAMRRHLPPRRAATGASLLAALPCRLVGLRDETFRRPARLTSPQRAPGAHPPCRPYSISIARLARYLRRPPRPGSSRKRPSYARGWVNVADAEVTARSTARRAGSLAAAAAAGPAPGDTGCGSAECLASFCCSGRPNSSIVGSSVRARSSLRSCPAAKPLSRRRQEDDPDAAASITESKLLQRLGISGLRRFICSGGSS